MKKITSTKRNQPHCIIQFVHGNKSESLDFSLMLQVIKFLCDQETKKIDNNTHHFFIHVVILISNFPTS